MKAIGSKIIVKTETENNEVTKQKSGLYLQSNDVATHDKALVLSVGEEIKANLKEGDTVLIYKNAGHDIQVDDEKFKVISIADILAVWEK